MVKMDANILILTSDVSTKNFLERLLQGEGYEVESCATEEEGLNRLKTKNFDLIICELEDEKIEGIKICKKIRQSFTLRYLSIILLTKKNYIIEKIKGIYAGGDDYVEKPIQPEELLTRVKTNLWRTKRDLDANPLTKLPGNVSILKELERRLKNKEKFCVGYVDLDNFKEYNNYYGFKKGDEVIKHTGVLITTCLEKWGTPTDFLGHIGGDDFIFITSQECLHKICKEIIANFETTILSFYNESDRKRGYIVTTNREGKITKTKLMTLSIGIVSTITCTFTHIGQLIQNLTQVKNYAKTFSHNIYIVDQRSS